MKNFLATHGLDILGGLAVMAVFRAVVYWSFDKKPKYRANGVPYTDKEEKTGPENDWQSTIVQ